MYTTNNKKKPMECTAKSTIEATAGKIREASFKEKNNQSAEEKINNFLDKILEAKRILREKINQIEEVISMLEQLTWYDLNTLEEESLKKLNDVISSTKDWSDSLYKNHDNCVLALQGQLDIEELDELKMTIDDLLEAASDLENIVFVYSRDPEFLHVTKELSKV